MTAPRRRAETFGRVAETCVAMFYRLKGYRLLAQRYRTPHGEIDLVMRRRQCLVFIEVKFRSTDQPLETTLPSPRQQQRIRTAALYFTSRSSAPAADHRFDVVVISGWRQMRLFTDAF